MRSRPQGVTDPPLEGHAIAARIRGDLKRIGTQIRPHDVLGDDVREYQPDAALQFSDIAFTAQNNEEFSVIRDSA